MTHRKLVLIGLCAAVLLSGASCRPSTENLPSIGQVVLASAIKNNNEPSNDLEQVAAGTAVLYLTAEVQRPTKSTSVTITWFRLPNQIIATETFNGSRGGSTSVNQTDFDQRYRSSWLASQVRRPGASWLLGDYKAEVELNGQLAKTLFFSVVRDSDADRESASQAISSLQFGDGLGDDNLIARSKTTFKRDADHLYVQLGLANSVQAGTDIEISIRYIREDLVVNTFSAVVGSDNTMLFDLNRDRFGKLWSDRLWPTGSFEVVVRVNGVVGRTVNFQIQA